MIKNKTFFSSYFLLKYFIFFLFTIVFSTLLIGISYYGTIKNLETNLETNGNSDERYCRRTTEQNN